MGNIHHRILVAAKRERALTCINLCISFKLPDDLKHREEEREDEHDQRVDSWLFDLGAYRSIRGYTNHVEPNLPTPPLAYQAYELSKEVLLSRKNSAESEDHKFCFFCIFDVVAFLKQQGLEPEPWLIAQAQFAALAWPEEAQRVDICPPDEDFVLALWGQKSRSFWWESENELDDDDYWDNDVYNNLAEMFRREIQRKNQVGDTHDQALAPAPVLVPSTQEVAQLRTEIELLRRQFVQVSNERNGLLAAAATSPTDADSTGLPPLIRMAIEVFKQHWNGQLDPSPEVRARANQAAIVSELRTRHPEITDAIAKAIDKVASPIDRDPKNTSGKYRLHRQS